MSSVSFLIHSAITVSLSKFIDCFYTRSPKNHSSRVRNSDADYWTFYVRCYNKVKSIKRKYFVWIAIVQQNRYTRWDDKWTRKKERLLIYYDCGQFYYTQYTYNNGLVDKVICWMWQFPYQRFFFYVAIKVEMMMMVATTIPSRSE